MLGCGRKISMALSPKNGFPLFNAKLILMEWLSLSSILIYFHCGCFVTVAISSGLIHTMNHFQNKLHYQVKALPRYRLSIRQLITQIDLHI